MKHSLHIDHTHIRSDTNISIPPAPAIQDLDREKPCRLSIYRVIKWTLTALELHLSSSQHTHNISGRRDLSLQNRNVSHLLKSDISPWWACPPFKSDNTNPVPDFFLQHNDSDSHYFSTCPDGDKSEQENIDDILPDLKHLFAKDTHSPIHDEAFQKKQHDRPPKGHDTWMEWPWELWSRLPKCLNALKNEYTSQNTLSTSALSLLATQSPSPTVVAVIDTGIIPHSALNDRILPGYDFIKNVECAGDGDGYDNDPTEKESFPDIPDRLEIWHGTQIAGIIAGTSLNTDDVSPLQNTIKILPIRFLGHGTCAGTDEDFINALKWAAGIPLAGVPLNTNPTKIINLSIGRVMDNCERFETVFTELYQRNITVIAGAGNRAMPASKYNFSNCPHVIAVGWQRTESYLASASNQGPPIIISAVVGDGVRTTSITGETLPLEESFIKVGGTSAAAALVSQTAALMHSVNNRLTPDDIRTILMNSSRPFQSIHPWCYLADSMFTIVLNILDTVFSTKYSSKQCNNPYCGTGHLDIGKAVAFAAGKEPEDSGNLLTNDNRWADDLLIIALNGTLILLICNGLLASTQMIASMRITTPEEQSTSNTMATRKKQISEEKPLPVMKIDDGMTLRSGKQLQCPSGNSNTHSGIRLRSGKILAKIDY